MPVNAGQVGWFDRRALDFSLSLFVPGGLDNVPTPAPLCYRKLMLCSPRYVAEDVDSGLPHLGGHRDYFLVLILG